MVEIVNKNEKELIYWDIPQLVIHEDGTVILTTGMHSSVSNWFQGLKVGTEDFKEWSKEGFTKFHGYIKNKE